MTKGRPALITRILAVLYLFASAAACPAQPPSVVVNATLLSPERTEMLDDAWVRIENGTITSVGSGPVNLNGVSVIDAEGGYLIPGLIDTHVHLYHATGLRRQYSENFDSLYGSYMQQQPRSFLYYGFTSVVELNANAETNRRFESAPLHPRLFHCGPGVILSDGFMAMELEGQPLDEASPGYLIDHYAGGMVPEGANASKHTPDAAIAYVQQQGGRCVKLYYEEALWWPGSAPDFRLPSTGIVRDVVSAARERNLPVILHATTPRGHRFALDAGVDILAHGMWEWPDQEFDAPDPNDEYRTIATAVAQSGIRLQPTFSTIRNTASMFEPGLLQNPQWAHAVPADYLHYLRTDAQQQRDAFVAMFGDQLPADESINSLPSLMASFNARYERLVGDMHDKGADLLFATDTAVGGFGWASPPGLAGYWEMQAWVRAGIPLRALFEAMTMDNAAALGLGDEIGTIEVGKRADMLLLRESPLLNATAYDTIELVILGGEPIERDTLSAEQASRTIARSIK